MIRKIASITFCMFCTIGIIAQMDKWTKFEFHTGNSILSMLSQEIDSITFGSGIKIDIEQKWNFSQSSGDTISWMVTGSQVINDMTLKDGKLYIVRRDGSNDKNTIVIVDAYTGEELGSLNTSSCSEGIYYISSIERLGNSIIACNLAGSSTNLVIYKWDDDNSSPTVLLNTRVSSRIGDAMSVSGDMTNGRIWFASGSEVFYYTIKNGSIVSTTPTNIILQKESSSYGVADHSSSNIMIENDGSFWVSSRHPHYRPAHFSANGIFIEELPEGLTDNQGTDMKIFTYNGEKYAVASTYLNLNNSSLADGAVSIINLTTNSLVMTLPTLGLGSTRNTSYRNSICTEVHDNYFYVWVNIPFQGAACYKYSRNSSALEHIWIHGATITNSVNADDYIEFKPIDGAEPEIMPTDQYGISIGYEVDLGLSAIWSGWDLGATSIRGYGGHHAWGELEPRTSNFRKTGYQYYFIFESGEGYIHIGDDISGTKYDAARHKLGGDWRMPTASEAQELIDSCSWELIACDTIVGYKVTGPNGNSIFLPHNGCYLDDKLSHRKEHFCYWIGSLYDPTKAKLLFNGKSGNIPEVSYDSRRTGHCIRPVRSKK